MKWQPIQTAPRDGTSILVAVLGANNIFIAVYRKWYSESLRADVVTWWSNGAKNSYQPDQLMLNPSHWMPLPDLPVE